MRFISLDIAFLLAIIIPTTLFFIVTFVGLYMITKFFNWINPKSKWIFFPLVVRDLEESRQ